MKYRSPRAPRPPQVVGPVHRYFRYGTKPMWILIGLLVVAMVPQTFASVFEWSDRIRAGLFAFQMFILGIILAPTLPFWTPVRSYDRPSEPETTTGNPSPHDGF